MAFVRAESGSRSVLEVAGISAAIGACLALSTRVTVAQEAVPALAVMWSTTVTAIEHPDWTIADLFACNCTPETYELLDELLLPENDHLSAEEIQRALRDHNQAAIQRLFTETAAQYACLLYTSPSPRDS